ncbi:high mobility group protein 1 [Fusobacterium animalis]|uniref:high mobility group protein 1 n=1 Tax=Fusobacterium animalis TaxID=76859 RepID=UPI0030CB326D
MSELEQKVETAFKPIVSDDKADKQVDKIIESEERITEKVEKNEYEGFANGFPDWSLEPPQVAVRRKK